MKGTLVVNGNTECGSRGESWRKRVRREGLKCVLCSARENRRVV